MSQPNVHGSDSERSASDLASGDSVVLSDCNAMIARLYHFLDGELTEERRLGIQAHLDACPSCFGAFDFEAELRIVVSKRVHTVVPEALVLRIRQSICPPPA